MSLEENMEIVRNNIEKAMQRAGRQDKVKIIGITKTRTPQEIDALLPLGIDTIGENRVQEFLDKYTKLNSCFDMQMVGQLQSNKVKYLVDKISCIQSLDREGLAAEIEKQCLRFGRTMQVLVELNLTGEAGRGGIAANKEDLLAFCAGLEQYGSIQLKGVMAVAPLGLSEKALKETFVAVRNLHECVQARYPMADRLSMGMSGDYVQAIEEGATEIRLGSALFGKRN